MSKKKTSAKKKKGSKTSAPVEKSPVSIRSITLLILCGMMLVLGARVGGGEELALFDLVPFGLWLVSAWFLVVFLKLGGYAGPPALPATLLMLSVVGVLVRSRMAGSV